ncbi:reverse gyrase (plasmid) [Thermus thermophilus]|uniref:reverse gyrase n=1 Tax=Thermus thermophilus TaxID=274 RepID=UPI002053B53F|nr:reverse gyrase [Thermus thermophilus]BDG27561.1 reverse gyrase [Thermus thermophilus]
MIPARYAAYCPNCGGEVESERLAAGLACARCQPDPAKPPLPGALARFFAQEEALADWARFFAAHVGAPPWPLQRAWAARVVQGRSFAMLAPTGIGKTTFGLLTALWLAREGRRSYLVFPTRLLVAQAAERLRALRAPFVAYTGKPKEKEALLEGERPIGLFTVAFLYKNHARLPRPVDFLFVDDVDSLLKSARNVDRVLELLGFAPEDLEKGLSLIRLRRKNPEEAERMAEGLRRKARGVLAVASATARPRSPRVHLFRELLGFEVGTPSFALRKVADLYEEAFGLSQEALWARGAEWARRLGGGGLLFLPGDLPKEAALDLARFLRARGLRAKAYLEPEALEAFRRGEADHLVGFASWRNPLARGLDLPGRVRYALFLGVPKLRFALGEDLAPGELVRLGLALLPLLEDPGLKALVRSLARRPGLQEKEVAPLRQALLERLADPAFRARVAESPEVGLTFLGEKPVLVFADVTGYLQASGRTSRLTPAGLTQGLALLLAEHRKAFTALTRRLGYLLEAPPRPVAEVDLEALLKRVDEDRDRLARGERGGLALPERVVVVESPNKARTLAGFFGRPMRRYLPGLVVYEALSEEGYLVVTATRGHVTDLALRGGLYGVETAPAYRPRYHPLRACPEGSVPDPFCPDGRASRPDRDQALEALRSLALEAQDFLLATDPDTEGEKIAWDVLLALRAFGKGVARGEFHAVTPRAFLEALRRPREVKEDLVEAQMVRRIADRWIGFALSEDLQKLLRRRSLSAGRVQTPVLGWVIAREREARTRLPFTEVALRGLTLRFPGEVKAKTLLLEVLEEGEREQNLLPPYTTDALLADASKEGFRVPEAMALAQDLFEAGLITYHRTDATRVAPEGMALARRLIEARFGPEYARPRPWGEGGAHEAIRPTRPLWPEDLEEAGLLAALPLSEAHGRLYSLIFRRFLASQMAPARVREKRLRACLGEACQELTLRVALLFPGFARVWPLGLDPDLEAGPYAVAPKTVRLPKAARYTEGELVAEMKRRGLGRPSTYAATVERLLERRYVVRRGPFLVPTRLGERVYALLTERPPLAPVARRFVGEAFTREVEAWMDRVEAGEDPVPLLRELHRATLALLEALEDEGPS